MAFKGNPFALLKDDDDGDFSPLLPPLPESKTPAKPHNVRSERGIGRGRGRGDRRRGSGRNSGTDVERLGHGQQNAMQKNQERGNNYHQSYGYKRYNGYSDGYRQHRGRVNGYQQQNRGDNGYRKNDVHEQNNADSTKPYIRDSYSNKEDGNEQGQWHAIGGGKGSRFDEKNGFTNQDQVLDGNPQKESKWVEKDSGGSHGKLTGGKFYAGDANQFNNLRSSSGGERRGNRGSYSRNWDKDDSSLARRGNGEVKTSEKKEALGGNKKLMDADEKHTSVKWKGTGEVSEEGELKQNGQEVPTGNKSEEGIKEEKEVINMTLQEYEKQLLQKRKTLEALKTQERTVTLNKDFESMQLVGKKKEDFALVEQHYDKEKLKKDDSLEKDEELRKVCGAIPRAWYQGRGERRGGYRRGYSRAATTGEGEAPETGDSHKIPSQTPCVEDLEQFPRLGS